MELNDLNTQNKRESKKLLIFAVYINFGTQCQAKRSYGTQNMSCYLKEKFARIENHTDYIVEFFIIPIYSGESKMECIFQPGDISNVSEINGLAENILQEYEKSLT